MLRRALGRCFSIELFCKEVADAIIEGRSSNEKAEEVAEEVTPAFPKLIYALDENNIREDAPYWYLTKLAAECTAKRMVPDYISNKVERESKNGDEYPCINVTVPFKSNLNSKTYLNGENL